MIDISMKYFKRKEFACKCGCGFDTVDYKLLEIVENVRAHFNKPTTITSGCRCEKHNKSVGGASGSFHTIGKACDLKVKDTDPLEVYKFIDNKYPNTFGLGLYNSWVHVDSRTNKARWNKTKKKGTK